MTSHAARYAAFKERQAATSHTIDGFAALYDFAFDPFQERACKALEQGHGVLVAAPTGSGKTVVGEFAVHLALRSGGKCFYTTPIKALSNQKYNDLVDRYGEESVGLLTGDNSVNGEAPVVVMTTEVLRNMLYAGSHTLSGLAYVVLDEVHYLADRFRGAVWEEVIIHLPESVSVAALSATVSNAEEFGDWLQQVRGDTTVIVDEKRPVPLWQHMMVGERVRDLFLPLEEPQPQEEAEERRGRRRHRRGAESRSPVVEVGGERLRINPRLMRLAEADHRLTQVSERRHPRGGRRNPRPRSSVEVPGRGAMVRALDDEGLLPAIVFIFSRAGCDAAVREFVRGEQDLTSEQEAAQIRLVVEERCAHIPQADRAVLGYRDWLAGLERGVSAHHAGMLPPFKEVVEELFSQGLIRAVFATETLALGINMPARSVVLEKLDKWNGEAHVDLTPGEYTQLTGRAGRRGIDVEGHAVVLWQPGIDPERVAGLAGTRTYPLNSSFRPSYNMAVNLVGQVGRRRSRRLLESSFAQFQADRAVVGLTRRLRRQEEALEGYAQAASCHLGDFMEYARMRRRLSDLESRAAKDRKGARREQARRSLERLRPGDIIRVPAGRHSGHALVLDTGLGHEPAPLVLTPKRQVKRLNAADFPEPVEAAGRLRIPKGFSARSPQARRDLASRLSERLSTQEPEAPRRDAGQGHNSDPEAARLRKELRSHPCHGCAEREDHARWAERYFRLAKETEELRGRVEGRTHVVARTFDRVCSVLDELGYLDGDSVSAAGRRLAALYSELDLLASECLRRGLWEGLAPPELAACVSALVYESRRTDEAFPRVPQACEDVLGAMLRVWGELHEVEGRHRVSFLREPDPGFCWTVHRWAGGATLDRVLREAGMPAGDFVRSAKQLVDLLGQIADATDSGELRRTARAAMDAVNRGVVGYSSVA